MAGPMPPLSSNLFIRYRSHATSHSRVSILLATRIIHTLGWMLVCARSCTLRGLNYSSVTATRRLAQTRFMPFERCRVAVSRHGVSYRASSQLSSIESAIKHQVSAIEHRVDRLASTVKPRWHSRRRHGTSDCSYTQASHHSEAARIVFFGHSKETSRRGHTSILACFCSGA